MLQFQIDLRENLVALHNLFVFLSNDYFNVQDLLDRNLRVLKMRHDLETGLQRLYDVNPNNIVLHLLTEVFLLNLSNDGKTLRHFARNSRHVMLRDTKKQDLGIDLFSSQSCALFASLLERPIGRITKASKSVRNVFGLSREDVIGKNCGIFMPPAVEECHNSILENFVEFGTMDVIKQGAISYAARNREGFVINIVKRIRIDYTDSDFGISAHFVLPQQGSDFFIVKHDGTLNASSKNIYDFCFRRLFKDQISNYNKGQRGGGGGNRAG